MTRARYTCVGYRHVLRGYRGAPRRATTLLHTAKKRAGLLPALPRISRRA